MKSQLTCLSPAKINWFLHITGQRENGYHELQTLFQFVSLYDELTFSLNDTPHIHLSGDLSGVSAEQNLIFKAAQALQKFQTVKKGVCINVDKHIPSGAGLGGGSSNAATTLLCLNKLWQLNLSLEQLATIGLKLGADVPVFVKGQNAFAEGIGEYLYPAELPEQTLLLAFPQNCHISTQAIFSAETLTRDTKKIDFIDYSFKNTHNDCQSVAKARFPLVAKTLDWLLEYAPSRMTGTGACCFALFDSPQQAKKIAATAPQGIETYIVNTLKTSPVHLFLNEQY